MPKSNVSAAMRDAVGRQVGRRVSFPVAESDIRRWAIAVYYPPEPPRQFWELPMPGPPGTAASSRPRTSTPTYRPLKEGRRRSRVARIPSWMSSVAIVSG